MFQTQYSLFDRFLRSRRNGLIASGIIALILGLIFVFAPIISAGFVAILVVVALAVGLLLDGIGSLVSANRGRKAEAPGWGWSLASGIVLVILGVLALIFPFVTAVAGSIVVLWLLVIGTIVRGVADIGSRTLGGWGTAIGVVAIIFGVLLGIVLFLNPAAVLLSLVWVAGVFAIAWGILALIGAWRINRTRQNAEEARG